MDELLKCIEEALFIYYRQIGLDDSMTGPRIRILIDLITGDVQNYYNTKSRKSLDALTIACDMRCHRASMNILFREKISVVAIVTGTCKTFASASTPVSVPPPASVSPPVSVSPPEPEYINPKVISNEVTDSLDLADKT